MSFRLAQPASSPGDHAVHTAPRADGVRSVIDFVLRNRIHLLPAVALIAWAAPPLYGSTPAWAALPSTLLAILGIYELNRLTDTVEDEINDPAAYAKTQSAQTRVRIVAVGALSASIVLSIIVTNYAASIALSVMLLAGVLYSVPFFLGLRLKQVPLVKNVLPSIVWPCLTIVYPAMSGTGAHGWLVVLGVSALSWAIFTIEVAWDVRDSRGDLVAGIRTLAHAMGARRALLVPLTGSCGEALLVAALVYSGKLASLWVLPAGFLILLPAIAYLWRDALAHDRDRSHLLVLLNTLALILLGLAGRWEG